VAEQNSSPVFTIKAKPTFEWPVTVPSPEGDLTIRLVFKHKTRDELKEFFERKAKTDDGGADKVASHLMEIVDGWQNTDTPFSEQALNDLIQNYHVSLSSIFDAYIKALTEGKAKN
jgi:hypothetical protein